MSLEITYTIAAVPPDPDPDPALVEVEIDHVAEGMARVLFQYQESERLKAWISVYLASHDELDATLTAVRTLVLNIPEAEGAQLDLLGRIVGETRAGQDD